MTHVFEVLSPIMTHKLARRIRRVREYRKRQHPESFAYTQAAVARALGVSQPAYSKMESGQISTVVKSAKLAEVLGVDPFKLYRVRGRDRRRGARR